MGVIYKITNDINGKSYIGQSINFQERKRQHFDEKTWAKYPNIALYKAMKKYGKENFSIKVIDEVPDYMLNCKEQYYIQMFDTYRNGYNMTLGGDAFSNNKAKIQVIMYDKNLNYVNYFESIAEASLYLFWKGHSTNYKNTTSGISKCLSGKQKYVNDHFLFKYDHNSIQATALVGRKGDEKIVFGNITYAVDWIIANNLSNSDIRHSIISHLKRVVDTDYTYCEYNWRYETIILDCPPVVCTETAALADLLD